MHTQRKRLLIVAPYRDEEAFIETMATRLDADIELLNYSTNRSVSRGVWRRHAVILLMAFRAFRKSGDKDLILFGEQFVGLYYAFFRRLFFWVRNPSRSMVLQLIYNRKAGVAGSCYRALYGWLIASSSLDYMVCHASLEREYYREEFGDAIGKKIAFVPFGRNTPGTHGHPELPGRAAAHGYFFSGGTSNRDYRTLIDAFRGISAQLVIACHANDIRGIELPENVVALHDAFGALFQDYIDRAYAVILPILRTDVSAGQLVLIDAMRSGKVAIVTSGSCMEDYVDQTCALSVPAQDADALARAITFLEANEAVCERLGNAARERYEHEFTRRAFAERLCDVFLSGARPKVAGLIESLPSATPVGLV